MGEFLPLTANRKYVAQYALPPATYVRPFLFGGGAPPQFQCSLQCGRRTGPILVQCTWNSLTCRKRKTFNKI